eukprot:TRINITY_DN1838_c0_g1_i4.p1 TRINITY_DN1838_c0_g1~~TRINITY_DN1838_c0_g1_i4.p1  ORF type:complete len:394 (-),score=64.57 TRINITY_DN1838_c0_g1_i4:889-2070(-)
MLGTIFSGGVMLAAGMVQLLGNATSVPEGSQKSDTLLGLLFPLTTFLTALGSLVMLTMDVIIVAVKNSQLQNVNIEEVELTPHKRNFNSNSDEHDIRENQERIDGNTSNRNTNMVVNENMTSISIENTNPCTDSKQVDDSELQVVKLDKEDAIPQDGSTNHQNHNVNSENKNNNDSKNYSNGAVEIEKEKEESVKQEQHVKFIDQKMMEMGREKEESVQQEQHVKVIDKKELNQPQNSCMLPGEVTLAMSIALSLAIFIDSLIQGAASGAEEHTYKLQDNFFAIILNQAVYLFVLGITLLESKPSTFLFWIIITPSILSLPMGLFIGYGQGQGLGGKGGSALNALTAGVFLYVATMLVIPRELDNNSQKRERVWKLAFLWVGFGFSSLLTIWT